MKKTHQRLEDEDLGEYEADYGTETAFMSRDYVGPLFLGIEAHPSGGIGIVDESGRLVLTGDIPVAALGAGRFAVESSCLFDLLRPYAPEIKYAIVEHAAKRPAYTTGVVDTVLRLLKIAHVTLPAAKSRPVARLRMDEEAILAAVFRRWPSARLDSRGDHSRAKALQLALMAAECESRDGVLAA